MAPCFFLIIFLSHICVRIFLIYVSFSEKGQNVYLCDIKQVHHLRLHRSESGQARYDNRACLYIHL